MTGLAAGSALDRSGWLLLLLDRATLGAQGPEDLDPVRIQKGMFLLSKRGPERDVYEFQPYDWGPFSSDIYADLASAARQGYLTEERVPGRTWSTYRITARGHERALALAAQMRAEDVAWLRQAREFLTTRSFAQLLREIYDLYPDYAVNSRFGG
jgi:DNA-binding PadR family transcriptional regulator